LSSGSNSTTQCDESGIPSHNFYKKHTVVRSGRTPNSVDGFNGCIERSIVSDGVICSKNIIIDGSGDSDERKSKFFVKNGGTGKRTVTANYYQTFNPIVLKVFKCFFTSFLGSEFFGTSSL